MSDPIFSPVREYCTPGCNEGPDGRPTRSTLSSFATVKLRTKVTKGAGSPKAAETMAFKLMQEAEKRWRRIRGYKEIENVLSGIAYSDGSVVTPNSHREVVG